MLSGLDIQKQSSIDRIFNVLISPKLKFDLNYPGYICYHLNFSDLHSQLNFPIESIKPGPQNLCELNSYLNHLNITLMDVQPEIFDQPGRKVILIIVGITGQSKISIYNIGQINSLTNKILMGTLPDQDIMNPWLTLDIKVNIFQRIIQKYQPKKLLNSDKINVFLHKSNDQTIFGQLNSEEFELICRERLICQPFLELVLKTFSESQIIILMIENYLIWYPLLIEYQSENNMFRWRPIDFY